jgi:hypothetical protein
VIPPQLSARLGLRQGQADTYRLLQTVSFESLNEAQLASANGGRHLHRVLNVARTVLSDLVVVSAI